MKITIIGGLDAWAWRLVKRLLLSCKGFPAFDAFDAKQWLCEQFEIYVNWIPVDSILNELVREGKAEIAGLSDEGYVLYRIL